MRLLHVTPTYAPSVGGIEEVVANLARMARASGIQADVAHVAPGLHSGERRQGSFSVHTLPLLGHRLLGWAPGLAQLAAGYDLLHVHDPQVGALTLNIGGAAARVPALLSTHGGFFHTRSARLAKRVHASLTAPQLLRRYVRVLASSHTDLAHFQQLSRNVVLVENGVDIHRLAPAARRDASDLTRWIFWGRFSRNKRIDALIRLVATLAEAGLDIDLAICGSDFDDNLGALRELVATLGMEGRIAFRTGLDDSALRAEVATRSVFVLPSEYEGFGLSLIEAMAAGLIPVCRNIAPMNALAASAALLLDFDAGAGDLARVRQLLASSAEDTRQRRALAMQRAVSFDWDARFDVFLRHYEACMRPALQGADSHGRG